MHGRAGERQEPWLLIKERDDAARPAAEYSVVEPMPDSVLSGRTIDGRGRAGDDGEGSCRRGDRGARRPTAKSAATARSARTAEDAGDATRPRRRRGRRRRAAAQRRDRAAPAAQRDGAPPRPRDSRRRTARSKRRRCPPTLSRRSSRRWSDAARTTPAGSTRSSSTATACSRASTATTCASSRATATTGRRSCAALARDRGARPRRRAGSTARSSCIDANGTPDFNALQNAFDARAPTPSSTTCSTCRTSPATTCARVPLVERRALLAALLDAARRRRQRVRFSEDFDATPEELLRTPAGCGLEGMIGKRADSPYVSRRSPTWIKLKCTQRQEFVIGGYTDPKGSRTGIGSLLLGIHDEAGQAALAGSVGSGFDEKTLADADARRSSAIAADKTPFFEKPRDVARPLGEAASSSPRCRSANGRRTAASATPVFHGLRDDKPAARDHARAAGARRGDGRRSGAKRRAAQRASKAAQPRRPRGRRTGNDDGHGRRPRAKTRRRRDRRRHPHHPSGAGRSTRHRADQARPRQLLPRASRAASCRTSRAGRCRWCARRPASAASCSSRSHADTLKIPELQQLDPAISTRPPAADRGRLVHRADRRGADQRRSSSTPGTRRRATSTQPDRMVFDLDPGEGVAWPQMQEGGGADARAARRARPGELPQDERRQGPARRRAARRRSDDWDTVKEFSQGDRRAHGATRVPSASSPRAGRRTASARSSSTTCATASARRRRAPGRRARGPASGVSVPVRLGRARRAHRRRPLDDRQRPRAPRGARRPVARLRQDAADARQGDEGASASSASRPGPRVKPQIAPTLPVTGRTMPVM